MEIEILSADANVSRICKEYWEIGESGNFRYSVSEISRRNNISAREVANIVSENCIANSDDVACDHCFKPYIYKNRSDFQNFKISSDWICPECNETIKEQLETQKQDALLNAWETCFRNPITPESITFRHVVLLLALMKFGASEDFVFIEPYDSICTGVLSPNPDYDRGIIMELYKAGLIAIDPASHPSTTILNDDGSFSFYHSRVRWAVITKNKQAEFYRALETRVSFDNILDNWVFVENLCKEVSLAECSGYLKMALEEHSLGYDFGEKTISVLQLGLENFSVAQMYGFIWRAAKDAAAYFARGGAYREQASKTVVGNIEKQIERAIVNKWDVTLYRRNYNAPQSILSRVLFNQLLGTDDGGFDLQIDHLLKDKMPKL